MLYLIARPINGITINGNEYLLDENNNILTFDTKEECSMHCKKVGLDDSYIWEAEGIFPRNSSLSELKGSSSIEKDVTKIIIISGNSPQIDQQIEDKIKNDFKEGE